MHFLRLLLPLLFITVAPTNGSVLFAANSRDFLRIAEKVLPKGMASKITDYLKLLSLPNTKNEEVEEYLAENLRVDNEEFYKQDPATFVNENTKRHYSVNLKDLMGHVKNLIASVFNKKDEDTRLETKNVDSAKAFGRESHDTVQVQKFDWKERLEEIKKTEKEKRGHSEESTKKREKKNKIKEHNDKAKNHEPPTKSYFKYFTTQKAPKFDSKNNNFNKERVKSKEDRERKKVSSERGSFEKSNDKDKASYENDKRFTRIFEDEPSENRENDEEKENSGESDKSLKRISNERIHGNRERMKTNQQAKFPKQQEKSPNKFDPETKISEPYRKPLKHSDNKSSEEKHPRQEGREGKKTRFEIEDGFKKDLRTLNEDELAKPIDVSHKKYHEEYIGVGKSIRDWDAEPMNKIIGTKIPTRKHFTMTTPDLYNKQENFAVPQNKDEPIPESDQEAERFPKERPYLTGIINGKRQTVKNPPVKRSPLEPRETKVRRQFK